MGFNIFNFFNKEECKKLDLSKLPSLGLFYKDGFEIYISKCSEQYIQEYVTKFDTSNINSILKRISRVIIDHTTYPEGFSYKDIVSIDLVFIFLEIASYTNGYPVSLSHYDESSGEYIKIEISTDTFKYHKFSEKSMSSYNKIDKCFDINGYMVSLPTTGAEEDLTEFLTAITPIPGSQKYNDYEYDFLYVLGGITELSVKKIHNLIHIFNNDITDDEKKKLTKAVDVVKKSQKYQVEYDGNVVALSSKLDLLNIFKK